MAYNLPECCTRNPVGESIKCLILRFKVIVTRKLPNTVEARLKELFDVEFSQNDIPLNRSELVTAMQRADVLVPTLNDNIDASVLAEAGNQLKLISKLWLWR